MSRVATRVGHLQQSKVMIDTSGTAPPLPPAAGSRYASLQPRTAPDVAGDILRGADEIAQFLFGHQRYRRRVYNLVGRKQLPIFRMGPSICARKSVLLQWIEAQEGASKGSPCTSTEG
jgi:hypothetical protein